MRWLGAQSISSRLLAVEVGKTPNVIENLYVEWQKMVMSNSPRWHSCAQASAQRVPVPREAVAIGEILCEPSPWIAHVNSPWREHSRTKKVIGLDWHNVIEVNLIVSPQRRQRVRDLCQLHVVYILSFV